MDNQLLDDDFGYEELLEEPIKEPPLSEKDVKTLHIFSFLSCGVAIVVLFVIRVVYGNEILEKIIGRGNLDFTKDEAAFAHIIFTKTIIFAGWLLVNYLIFSLILSSLRNQWVQFFKIGSSDSLYADLALKMAGFIFAIALFGLIASILMIIISGLFLVVLGLLSLIFYLIGASLHLDYYAIDIGFPIGMILAYYVINKKLKALIENHYDSSKSSSIPAFWD